MVGNGHQNVQADAIAYVQRQKTNIYTTARKINPRISAQDFEDLVNEGYAIALELVATGDIAQLKSLFWPKLQRSVWAGYDYLVDYVDFCDDSNSPIHTAVASDVLEKMLEDERFEGTASSVLDFLTTAEQRVLCLLLGLTARGCCPEVESAMILGVSRATVRVLLGRIIGKIQTAVRNRSAQGMLVLSRGKPKRRSASRPRAATSQTPTFPPSSLF